MVAPRLGQHLEGHLGDQAQAAVAAGHEPRDIVARDVLHHLAAKAQVLAVAGDDAAAEDEVADRPCPRPARPGQARRDHPRRRSPSPA